MYILIGTSLSFDVKHSTFKNLGLYRIAWNGTEAPQILQGKTLIVKIDYHGIDYYRLIENQEEIDKLYKDHNAGIINASGLQFWAPSPLVERRVKNQLITGEIRKTQKNPTVSPQGGMSCESNSAMQSQMYWSKENND